MTFNTTSYLAGVGTVVAVLSTGFAGGYFLANPTRIDPPNRLQRLASEDHDAKGPATKNSVSSTVTAKPEVATAAPATQPQAVATATPDAPPVRVIPTATAVAQPAVPPAVPSVEAQTSENAAENAHTVSSEEKSASVERADLDRFDAKTGASKARAAEAKLVEKRKRSEARKLAGQQRKQRELEVATFAVRRIIHDRDAPEVVIRDRDARDVVVQNAEPETPRFNLFDR